MSQVVPGWALLLKRMFIAEVFLLMAEVILCIGLGSLAAGGVAGLGLPCLPAAFAEGPAKGSWSGSVVGSGSVLMGRLFFADGFAGTSGLSPSRVTVLGDVVGSRGHVRLVGRMDRERVLCTVVMPKAGRSWPEQ